MILKLDELSLSLPKQNRLLFSSYSSIIEAKDIIMFVGESGQGKTSLLKILAKLSLPSSGQILSPLITNSSSEIPLWRRTFTYVAQQAIMHNGTIEDNLRLPSHLHKVQFDENKARHYMEQVGLAHLDFKQDASHCSGGEQQRIALLRALLLNPTVLLLDEVTSAIDQQNTILVEALLKVWINEGQRAIVWISHHPQQVKRLANKVWHVDRHHISSYSIEDWLVREARIDESTHA